MTIALYLIIAAYHYDLLWFDLFITFEPHARATLTALAIALLVIDWAMFQLWRLTK